MLKMTNKAIQERTNEQAFTWMLYASIQDKSKFETIDILYYWFNLAFGRQLVEDDLSTELIDRIRIQLLTRGGVYKPILKDTHITKTLKEEIIFE